jgi:DEAD/DEAH box helicase domain-containing protein
LSGVQVAIDRLLGVIDGHPALVHLERFSSREARHRLPVPALAPALVERLPGPLWSHQAEALELARAGCSVVVSTGTASGKSLCYQLPIAEAILAAEEDLGPPSTALCLYPTKALAHDQLRSLTSLGLPGLVGACYDGDTDASARGWARRHANVVLSNPDMLHAGLLPHHAGWADFLSRLRYVVVDEMHTLRGVFGSHVAHLLRRLRRLCAHYGSEPVFLFGSATVGEPAALARALSGLPVVAVIDDGSPRGERFFALWNPPVLDPASGARASSHTETASLLADLVAGGSRALAFCRGRAAAESVAAEAVRVVGPALGPTIRSYRGGYLATERREIEEALVSSHLRGVVATSALELGVDIGGLDACILDGFPGTIASMWQQAGRAGRNQERSLAILVAGEDQLDRWLMAHPEELFSRPPEPAVVNPTNPYVAHPHLACAAYERPLDHGDDRWWADLDEGVRHLVADDQVVVRERRGYWAGHRPPAPTVSLRSASLHEYRIAHRDGTLVGTVDESRAFTTVHPGAVYLHQGRAYRVDELDVGDWVAWVTPSPGDEFTQVRSDTDVAVLSDDRCLPVAPGVALHLGAVEVRQQVVGYVRRSTLTRKRLGSEVLDLPPSCLVTRAFWYSMDEEVLHAAGVSPPAWPGALHALEHAAIGILPLFSLCDRWDVGGLSTACHPDTASPTVLVYDGYPGGAGIAELGFAAAADHLRATLEVVSSCRCSAGCPSCVQSPKCGNWNEPLDKAGAAAILESILG